MSQDNTEPSPDVDLNDPATQRDAFRVYEHMALACKLNGSIQLKRAWENLRDDLETMEDEDRFILLTDKIIECFCFDCINCDLTEKINRAYVRNRDKW